MQVQVLTLRPHPLLELLSRCQGAVEFDLDNGNLRVAVDHLDRLAQALPQHGRAQDMVTMYDRLNGTDELTQALTRGHREQYRLDIRVPALFPQHMMEEHAF